MCKRKTTAGEHVGDRLLKPDSVPRSILIKAYTLIR